MFLQITKIFFPLWQSIDYLSTNFNTFRVFVGEHNWSLPGDGEQYVNVESIQIHPNYQPGPATLWANDYSLLKLVSPVTIPAAFLGLACLPPDVNQTFAGSSLITSGWGLIQGGGNLSPELKAATLVGLSAADCQSTFGSAVVGSHICASGIPTNATCQGDSGGEF